MTNEWTKVDFYGPNNSGQITRYAIADNASVSKFAVLQLLDNRSVSCGHKAQTHFRIAAEEHIAGQGITSIGCITQARMRFVASGAILLGQQIAPSSNIAEANIMTSCAISAIVGEGNSGVYCEDTLATGETGTARINQ